MKRWLAVLSCFEHVRTFGAQPILHKKVLEMCGVDMLGQAERMKTLAQYQHGLPDQKPSEEVDGRIIWRPAWSEHVDHTVNIRFLHSIVDEIMEHEKVSITSAEGTYNTHEQFYQDEALTGKRRAR